MGNLFQEDVKVGVVNEGQGGVGMVGSRHTDFSKKGGQISTILLGGIMRWSEEGSRGKEFEQFFL